MPRRQSRPPWRCATPCPTAATTRPPRSSSFPRRPTATPVVVCSPAAEAVRHPPPCSRQCEVDHSAHHLVVDAVDEQAALALRTERPAEPAGRAAAATHAAQRRDRGLRARLAARAALPACPRPGAAGPDRAVVPRADRRSGTALGYGAWVREGRRGRTGHDAPLLLAAGHPGFGFRQRRGVGAARRLERRQQHLGRAASRGPREPGRRRAGAARRGAARARIHLHLALGLRRALHRRPGRVESPPARHGARPGAAPADTAAGGAEHLGGGLLRPRPRPPARDRRDCRRRSGWSGSCSTTVGSPAGPPTRPDSATGRSRRRSGPPAWTR